MMEPKLRHANLFKRMLARMHRQPGGQSFVELIFVLTFLALLLTGMVEFGFMLNQYLHVLDGSREAARHASSQQAFILDTTGVSIASYYFPPFYYQAAAVAAQTADPVILNPINPDDIVISVFSLDGTTPTRFPLTDPSGWSLCDHYKLNADDSGAGYGGFAAYWPTVGAGVPTQLPAATWGVHCTHRQSQFSGTYITNQIDLTHMVGGAAPPNTGMVLVEIFYNYPQLLKLPVLTSVLPDPVPLSVYSIMPLSSAQPTQVH